MLSEYSNKPRNAKVPATIALISHATCHIPYAACRFPLLLLLLRAPNNLDWCEAGAAMLLRCFDVVLGLVPIKHRRHLHTANMQHDCMHASNIYLVIDNTIYSTHIHICISLQSQPASWATVAAAAVCKNHNNGRKLNVINMKVHTRNYKLPHLS